MLHSLTEWQYSRARQSRWSVPAKAHKVKITVYFIDDTFKWDVEQENWIECAIQSLPFPYLRLTWFAYLVTILSAREISIVGNSNLHWCRISEKPNEIRKCVEKGTRRKKSVYFTARHWSFLILKRNPICKIHPNLLIHVRRETVDRNNGRGCCTELAMNANYIKHLLRWPGGTRTRIGQGMPTL